MSNPEVSFGRLKPQHGGDIVMDIKTHVYASRVEILHALMSFSEGPDEIRELVAECEENQRLFFEDVRRHFEGNSVTHGGGVVLHEAPQRRYGPGGNPNTKKKFRGGVL